MNIETPQDNKLSTRNGVKMDSGGWILLYAAAVFIVVLFMNGSHDGFDDDDDYGPGHDTDLI